MTEQPTITDNRAAYYRRAYMRGHAARITAANIAAKSCAAYGIEGMQRHRIVRGAIRLYCQAGLSLNGLIMHIEAVCRRLVLLDELPAHLRRQAC